MIEGPEDNQALQITERYRDRIQRAQDHARATGQDFTREDYGHIHQEMTQSLANLAKRANKIREVAMARLAQRSGRLTDTNQETAIREAIQHAIRVVDGVMAYPIPGASL